jgi:trimethylamine---corrinoid protein Co-methyltransferase
VVHNAATLSGLVLLQLAFPGAPVFFAGAPSVIDVHTGGYTGGSPEDYLLAAAATQLAHFYGVPMAVGTMASGAKQPDWQAAVDDSLSTFASVMTSADMMNGAGLLNGSKILSYPHLVLETEIYGIVKRLAAGIVVDDEALAMDVIAAVGPGGTFLAEKHTRRHLRAIWRPGVWDRAPYEAWMRDGRRGALERATQVADGVLATHEPLPLKEDVAAELSAIVGRADREIARV